MALGQEAVDCRRLLPGEAPESESLEEIKHWYAVYIELWQGCLEIAQGLPPSEKELVLSRAQRFKAGRDFWTQRRREYFLSREASQV